MLQQISMPLSTATTLDSMLLRQYVNDFFDRVFNSYILQQKGIIHILVITKIRFTNGETRSLSEMRKVNIEDRHLYAKFLLLNFRTFLICTKILLLI